MTYIYAILIMGSSLCVGSLIGRHFSYREKFLRAILDFSNHLKNNISYRRDNIGDVFDNYVAGVSNELKKTFAICKSITINEADETYLNAISYLKKDEKMMVYKFFKSLGQGNELVEEDNIEGFKSYIADKYQDVSKQNAKNRPLAIKLSIAVGLVLTILII